MTITVRAPGKLFIAGEYAVVDPGQPSVIIAVDRYLEVQISEAEDAGSIHSPEYGRIPLVWTRDRSGVTVRPERHPYEYVLAVLTVMERLREELGVPGRFSHLRISSQLEDVSGRKFGLGSSSAVTVATARALDRFYGLGLDNRRIYQIAMIATASVAPAASGGDLAASAFGGWIRYSAPDRSLLLTRMLTGDIAELLNDAEAWAGFEVVRLPPPDGLDLIVGWTGEPASTTRLVDRAQQQKASDPAAYARFVAGSRERVFDLSDALVAGDDAAVKDAVRGARRLLQDLGSSLQLAIETPHLGVLCDIAERAGAAAKSSGAGGGDCGIVLADSATDVHGMLREWELSDIRTLSVTVHPPEGSTSGAV